MYLPKTWPSHPIPANELVLSSHPALTVYKTVTLTPVWPDDACPEAKARGTIPTVQASYPHARILLPLPLCSPTCSFPSRLASHSPLDIPFR